MKSVRPKLSAASLATAARHRSAYDSRRQASAFQFVLDRLQVVNAIAYIREATAIHIAVASDAPSKLAVLNLG